MHAVCENQNIAGIYAQWHLKIFTKGCSLVPSINIWYKKLVSAITLEFSHQRGHSPSI
jgi:hypothetical protein